MLGTRKPPTLTPVAVTVQPARRLTQLIAGLICYGVSMAMMVRAHLGLDPWDVLHQGLHQRTGLSFGLVTGLTGVLVLLAWIPLRQRPGVGTIANVIVIAVAVQLALDLLPAPAALPARIALLLGGVVLNALATASYVGARLGPGPRDGLMTGIHARAGLSIRFARISVEILVLITGWLLGGTVGVGTVLYAASIGALTQALLPLLVWRTGGDSDSAT
ncbi:MAG: YczE/YyaS/YitT family protein [Sciscionella sp.]